MNIEYTTRKMNNSNINTSTELLLPIGWVRTLDSNTGQYYYANQQTGESSWYPPQPIPPPPPLPVVVPVPLPPPPLPLVMQEQSHYNINSNTSTTIHDSNQYPMQLQYNNSSIQQNFSSPQHPMYPNCSSNNLPPHLQALNLPIPPSLGAVANDAAAVAFTGSTIAAAQIDQQQHIQIGAYNNATLQQQQSPQFFQFQQPTIHYQHGSNTQTPNTTAATPIESFQNDSNVHSQQHQSWNKWSRHDSNAYTGQHQPQRHIHQPLSMNSFSNAVAIGANTVPVKTIHSPSSTTTTGTTGTSLVKNNNSTTITDGSYPVLQARNLVDQLKRQHDIIANTSIITNTTTNDEMTDVPISTSNSLTNTNKQQQQQQQQEDDNNESRMQLKQIELSSFSAGQIADLCTIQIEKLQEDQLEQKQQQHEQEHSTSNSSTSNINIYYEPINPNYLDIHMKRTFMEQGRLETRLHSLYGKLKQI